MPTFGRVRQTADTYPIPAVIWLAGDVTSVPQTMLFDKLSAVKGVAGWDISGVGGVVAQVGRAVVWTAGSGKKIGYALLPAEAAGLRLFATWDDGTIGLWDSAGTRLVQIPWSWAATVCP